MKKPGSRRLCGVLIAIALSAIQLQAQTPTVNLGFEASVPGWMKEANVPAVGIGVIEA